MISLGNQPDGTNTTQADSFRRRLCSFLLISLSFFVASLLNSRVPGVGEPHYLSKAKAFANPDWCSRDFFLTSSNAHYVFYVLVGPFTKMVSLETVAFIGRAFQFVLLAAGWTMLCGTLGLNARRQVWSAALFVLLSMLGNVSGEWLIGGFESKVAAWAFCLMSMHFWIRGLQRGVISSAMMQSGLAGLCCGVACSLHPVVGAWLAICIAMASLYGRVRRVRRVPRAKEEPSFASIALRLIVFVVFTTIAALPGFLPALRLVFDTSLPESQRELANFYQVFWRLKHHLDPMEFTIWQWSYTLIGSYLLLKLVRQTQQKSDEVNSIDGSLDPWRNGLQPALRIVLASAVIAAVGVLIGFHIGPAKAIVNWEWRASLLKFYPFRMFDAFLPMAVAWLAVVSPKSSEVASSRTITGTIALAFAVSWFTSSSAPPGYNREQFEDWKQACDWIRQNTPADSLILTPRESFAFKWYADRAEFVCYKDCPQDAAGILEWNKRLWMLHDWTLNSSMDGQYNNSDVDVARNKTNCDYIVTRILGPFEATSLWQGKHWRIYQIPPRTAP